MSSSAVSVSFRTPVLPWSIAEDDERLFRRITLQVIGAAIVFGLVLPWLPVMQPDRTQPPDVPTRLAKIMIEQELPKPPPPPPLVSKQIRPELAVKLPEKVESKSPEPKSLPRRPEPRKVEPVPGAPVPEARQPVPDKPPGEVELAKRKAAGIGLLAMKEDLAEMHGAPVAVQLRTDIKQGPGVGTGAGVGVGAGDEAGLPARNLITSNALGGSGGINTASYSRNTGGGGLAGRATTLVEGVAGGGGGGYGGGGTKGRNGNGTGLGGPGGSGGGGGSLTKSGSGKASRSIEEIKLVFERNKGSIYAIYNRALREEPSLQGKVVVKLTIAPTGGVTDIRVESSELKTPDLEAKLAARIRQFDFGAKDVEIMVVTWPVDFLPS